MAVRFPLEDHSMKKAATAAALACAAAVFAANCGGGSGGGASSTPVSPTTGGGQTTVTISITGKGGKLAFNPNPASVSAGQLVVFKNNDVVTHHLILDDSSMQTTDIAPGASSAPVSMGTSGAQSYHCTIHPEMIGGF